MKIHQFFAIVSAFVLFLGVASANAAPWAGSGTSTDPYQIWNAADLNAIGADTAYYSSSFRLMADIDLAGITYTDAVIPYSDTIFTGVFDGDTHIIQSHNQYFRDQYKQPRPVWLFRRRPRRKRCPERRRH
ncbi:MAG: hypothetical protein WC454_06265 [Phycisphaerae bacterium]|jgi:hypothetical protein